MIEQKTTIGVIGASSLVGQSVLSQLQNQDNIQLIAFSREVHNDESQSNLLWCQLEKIAKWNNKITQWICVAPIWVLAEYYQALQVCGAKRVIALSSTSAITKQSSKNEKERAVVKQLLQGENSLQAWAEKNSIDWLILRPTLIYGYGKDKNIAVIANFIERFGFFPLFGKASGLRQPIHTDDVGLACIQALNAETVTNHCYEISGGETLAYHEMVKRIFLVQNKHPRIIHIPLSLFKIALRLLRIFPKFRHWSTEMVERMNKDLVFDAEAAKRDFDFVAKGFQP